MKYYKRLLIKDIEWEYNKHFCLLKNFKDAVVQISYHCNYKDLEELINAFRDLEEDYC